MRDPSTAQCFLVDSPTRPPGWRWDPDTGSARFHADLPAWAQHADGDCHGAVTALAPGATAAQADVHDRPPPVSAVVCSQEHYRVLHMKSTQYGHIIAETLDGQRRLTQIRTWFDPPSFTVLAERAPRLRGARVRLGSVHVQPTSPTCGEVTARLTTDRTDHALAMRVDFRDERWLGVDLVIG